MQETLNSLYQEKATKIETIKDLELSDDDVLVMVSKSDNRIDFFIPRTQFKAVSALYFEYDPVIFCKSVLSKALPKMKPYIDNQCIA